MQEFYVALTRILPQTQMHFKAGVKGFEGYPINEAFLVFQKNWSRTKWEKIFVLHTGVNIHFLVQKFSFNAYQKPKNILFWLKMVKFKFSYIFKVIFVSI